MDRGDLADLTAFVAVADRLSFRAAAAHLGVTPSALSHSMRQLEQRLGVRLLHRTTRSVSLTDARRRLLDRLRPAIHQIGGAVGYGFSEWPVKARHGPPHVGTMIWTNRAALGAVGRNGTDREEPHRAGPCRWDRSRHLRSSSWPSAPWCCHLPTAY
jgi:Bacterial regulatory helix-turn-helix protein, lysR family